MRKTTILTLWVSVLVFSLNVMVPVVIYPEVATFVGMNSRLAVAMSTAVP